MTMAQLGTILAIIFTGGAIAGGAWRVARALVRAAFIGQGVVDAVSENTTATSRLSEQFAQYQQVTDQRLQLLEESARRTRARLW